MVKSVVLRHPSTRPSRQPNLGPVWNPAGRFHRQQYHLPGGLQLQITRSFRGHSKTAGDINQHARVRDPALVPQRPGGLAIGLDANDAGSVIEHERKIVNLAGAIPNVGGFHDRANNTHVSKVHHGGDVANLLDREIAVCGHHQQTGQATGRQQECNQSKSSNEWMCCGVFATVRTTTGGADEAFATRTMVTACADSLIHRKSLEHRLTTRDGQGLSGLVTLVSQVEQRRHDVIGQATAIHGNLRRIEILHFVDTLSALDLARS